MNRLKSNKGVTLITMGVAVIVMLIILATIVFRANTSGEIQKLDNMYNDIRLLNEKINIYYYKNNKLPVLSEYSEIDRIPADVLNPNDNEVYYVIDIKALENITLSNNPNVSSNIYVINESSHTIYFPKGVKVENRTYYRLPDEYNKFSTSVQFNYLVEPERNTREALVRISAEETVYGIKKITFPDTTTKNYVENTKRIEETFSVIENKEYTFEIELYNTGEKAQQKVLVTNIDREGPTYTSLSTNNLTSAGYDVNIYGVSDISGVQKVEYEVWTSSNGTDDLIRKPMSYQQDGHWYGRVSIDEHNNENGTYVTKVYLYDTLGNVSEATINSTIVPLPPHTHSMGPWTQYSDTQHMRSCTCGLVEYANHSWGNYTRINDTTHQRTCTICGKAQSANHSWGNYTSTNATQHTRTCLLCNGVQTSNHGFGAYTYVNATTHKRICSTCNHTETSNHGWSGYTSQDSALHKRTCASCGANETANHSWGSYTTTGATQHRRTCTVCGLAQNADHSWSAYENTGNGTHRRTCSICSAVDEVSHTFGKWSSYNIYSCQHTCTVCAFTEMVSHSGSGSYQYYSGSLSSDYHRRGCSRCGGYQYQKHNWAKIESMPGYSKCSTCSLIKVSGS